MLLLLDSWGPFKDHTEILKHVPQGKRVFVKNIPPGCTGRIQPLDVFHFNPFKRFMKKITSFVQVQGIDFPIHRRDNLLKVVSLIFWQFSHPNFQDFVKYSWSAAGYTPRPAPFETPTQYCFDINDNMDCQEKGCKRLSFVRCAFCAKYLCFEDFIVAYHRDHC